jgi:hypothetical protein
MISSFHSPFEISYYSLHPAKTLRYFSDNTKKRKKKKKTKFKLSKNSFK